ncbi:PH domain-containing protein [Priestia megaterium]|nr:PH domain-containing protein [Priestia megaterium]
MIKMSKRLHPLYIVIDFVQYIKNNILPIAFLAFVQREILFTYWWVLLIIGAGIACFSFVKWRMFRYEVTESEIQIKKGIFKKENRFIQRTRIQSIQIDQPLLFRLLKLARLRIETASSGTDAEVDLPGILLHDAYKLKQTLQLNSKQVIEAKEEIQVLKVPIGRLALAAALSANFGYIFASLGVLYEYVDNFVNRWIQSAYEQVIQQSILAVILLAMIIIVIAYLLSILLYILRFGDFTVERYEKQLQIQYGILNKRSLNVPFHKIQAVTIEEGILRRLFGWCAISLKVVTSDAQQTIYLHPFLRTEELQAIFEQYLPNYEYVECTPNVVKSYVWYKLALEVAVTAVAAIGISFWKVQFIWIVLALSLIGGLLTWFGYRQGGVFMNNSFVSIRSQFIMRKTTIVQRKKIQRINIQAGRMFWKKGYRKIEFSTMGPAASYSAGYFPQIVWEPIFNEATVKCNS